MDSNDEDIIEGQRHRDHLIRSSAAITVAAVAVVVALDSMTNQPYCGELEDAISELADAISELADAIKSSSDGSNEREVAKEINEALFEMYEHDTVDKMTAATIFLMKNKWAAISILSASKEQRVTLLEAIMRASTSSP